MALIDELNEEGATIIVITHELEIAARFPRQIRMRDGQIVTDTSRSVVGSGAQPETGGSR
jgi:putative ABC transport system ATP-binding protein